MLKNFIAAGLVLIIAFSFNAPDTIGQTENSDAIAEAVAGLKLRSIGPALMGGRIADIAVSPNDRSTWYVAVGSGGCGKLPMPASPGSLFLMIS
ncbi:hypothetical protein IH970_01895 [candidate division KSB1 bacterium]|nr:hypothetical protein [candidate division KSB1 bacterium]